MAEASANRTSPGFNLFYVDDGYLNVDFVAEGTDGIFYLVPLEPGGWLKRSPYTGQVAHLAPVSREKSRTLIYYLYGDIGPISIRETNETAGTGDLVYRRDIASSAEG